MLNSGYLANVSTYLYSETYMSPWRAGEAYQCSVLPGYRPGGLGRPICVVCYRDIALSG